MVDRRGERNRVVHARMLRILFHRLTCAAFVLSCLLGCASRRGGYTTPGTLYVQLLGSWHSTIKLRNGQVVGTPAPRLVVARDRPDRSLWRGEITACRPGETQPYQLSPDGTFGLCSPEKLFELHVFRPWRFGGTERVVLNTFYTNASGSSFAWLDNYRFVALVLDRGCPLAHIYDYYPTRVVTFDRNGRRLAAGPCAYGIVAGRHRLALLGERRNSIFRQIRQSFYGCPDECNDGYDSFHHTWSVDGGKTWHDGVPMQFDGNDLLLYKDETAQAADSLLSERGDVAIKGDVFRVQWSI